MAGNCYEAAGELALVLALKLGPHNVTLCHATGRLQLGGPEIGHAWVESKQITHHCTMNFSVIIVHDPTFDFEIPKVAFEKMVKPIYVRRYDYSQMLDEMGKHEHYGPWDPRVDAALHADSP